MNRKRDYESIALRPRSCTCAALQSRPRRLFCEALLGTAVSISSFPALAQKSRPFRIAILTEGRDGVAPPFVDALKQGLKEHGYVEGQNIVLDQRSADAIPGRLSALAAELVRNKVDVIVAPTDGAIAAARRETQTIPIVMISSTDPVATGFVASLAKPGGNVTGFSTMSPEIGGKRLELLREIAPGLARVAIIWNPEIRGAVFDYKETENAARTLRVQLQSLEAVSRDDLDRALAAALQTGTQALIIPGGNPIALANRGRIAAFAQAHRLPAIYGHSELASAGGLMSYGSHPPDRWRRAASYIDKILKGTKPADLPVEQPTRFELVINLKTAKALGIAIPPSVRIRADRLIE